MTIKVLLLGFFLLPGCSCKRDNASWCWVVHSAIIHFLGVGTCFREFIYFLHSTKEEVVEHGAPSAIWADGNWEKNTHPNKEALNYFLACERVKVVWITFSIPHELWPLLRNQVLCGWGRFFWCTRSFRRRDMPFRRCDGEIQTNTGVWYGRDGCTFERRDGTKPVVKRP